MAHLVEFSARAFRDLEIPYIEKNAAESRAASRWYKELEKAVYALAEYPFRCPVAPEARRVRRKLRHLLYGQKSHVYRVIYEVEERRKVVWVLHIRHGARRKLKFSDLG
jgi:toxin ParE1/3/4